MTPARLNAGSEISELDETLANLICYVESAGGHDRFRVQSARAHRKPSTTLFRYGCHWQHSAAEA
jgi:hypothetical protein